MARKGDALLPWGTARLNMLCLPMLINTFMYYQTMSPAFLAIWQLFFSFVFSLFILALADVRLRLVKIERLIYEIICYYCQL